MLRALSGSVESVTTGADGTLWLSFAARDYSYEGLKVNRPLYLTKYRVVLTPADSELTGRLAECVLPRCAAHTARRAHVEVLAGVGA